MRKLAILGASGHGRVVGDTAECAGWEEIVFFDDAWPDLLSNSKWKVLGNTSDLLKEKEKYDGVIVAIGNNKTRLNKCNELLGQGLTLISIVHPTAYLSRNSNIGPGSVLFAGTIVNIGVCSGLASIVNTGSTIDHDCKLGDAVHVSPGVNLAGEVSIGDLTWIGIGACVRQRVRIGERVVVGAGAVVIEDIDKDLTVAGIPAKPVYR